VEENHYEVLEVDRTAGPEEIERAYRLGRAAFAEDSLGIYSVYDESERQAILTRIEEAYAVLSDPERRAAYDATLPPVQPEPGPGAVELDLELPAQDRPRDAGEAPVALRDFDDLDDEEGGDFDGARLRRCRVRRGLELDQIASITKVNPRYLACIEEERFDELPAPVYVRGFVHAYARCLGLDPGPVASAYLERFERARSGGDRRPRALGRR